MSYSDDYDESDEWKNLKKHKPFKLNPSGPYKVKLLFKNVNWSITIENISMEDFKVTAISDKKVSKSHLSVLKKYLQDEGFEQAARKHNLFW